MKEVVTEVTFTVLDKLVVADPCYIDEDDAPIGNLGSGMGVILYNAAGEWRGHIEYQDEGRWGRRVGKLIVERTNGAPIWNIETIDRNGVDSGQMYAGCFSQLPLDYEEVLDHYTPIIEGYSSWTNLDFFGHGEGCVSSTGLGDGRYPVEVGYDKDGRPQRVIVEFLSCMLDDEGEVYSDKSDDLMERMANR